MIIKAIPYLVCFGVFMCVSLGTRKTCF